ncbi:hypothetical protein MLD38_005505 [Melastoma candidum]|uniref:Uncharacterized protein n=1 Tax=Melastoma candidum TaxID=119954 RepID=A0ACB9RKE2_9MYRT|nr:hypothetical protein MLD38_005505 [Melastoma candidum]
MEDCNALAADCIVVSCCCQCLILQILILVLIKLPFRLIRKLKERISQKIIKHSKKEARGMEVFSFRYPDSVGSTPRISVAFSDRSSFGYCAHEAEMVLEDLYKKGEFTFGSFWGRELDGSLLTAENQEFDISLVQLEVVRSGDASSIRSRNSSSLRRLVIYA